MSRIFNQAITITGNQTVDQDRLMAIGDTFATELKREGGDVSTIHVQRHPGLEPNELKIDVFYEFDFKSPDGAFRFKGQQEFTVYGDNALVAIYKRQTLLGRDLNETLRGIHNMTTRIISGDYSVADAADYIAKTIDEALKTFPNTSAA